MKNQDILKNINEMKYLFDYKRGRVISEQNINELTNAGGEPIPVAETTTVASTGAQTTKAAGTRRGTGLEVQKLLNTKFSSGLKEDGKVGPLTLGAIMTALEGGSSSTSTGATGQTTTVAPGATGQTTTVAPGATGQTTTVAVTGAPPDASKVVDNDF